MAQSASTYAAHEYANPPKRLERDLVKNTSLTTGATLTYDVETSHTDWIEVSGKLNATVTTTDLTVSVVPYQEDGTTLSPDSLPLDNSTGTQPGSVSDGTNVQYFGRFSVIGIGKVRITWTNHNAATKTLALAGWRTENYAGR